MRSPFKTLIVSATLALGFAACGGPQEEQETSQEELEAIGAAATCPVAVGRELMITAVSVVEDPVRTKWTGSLANKNDGAWQFGRLMTAMAGTKNLDFIGLAEPVVGQSHGQWRSSPPGPRSRHHQRLRSAASST
jgi:hypothetical protein